MKIGLRDLQGGEKGGFLAATRSHKRDHNCCMVMVHAFNPSTWEAEAGGSL